MSDGFYVDVEELYNVFEGLQSQSEKIIASLETAKSSYNSVITSNSMYGDVGQAIAGEINSSHNMLLMQLKDLLYSLQSDFSKEVESFQSATGEKSSTAIISHSYLKSTSEYFDTLKGEIDQIRKTINSATDSVSDLVSVTSDAKNYEYFGGNLSNAKDVVTNTIEKVSAWDSQGTALTTETSLQNLQELLGQLHQTDGLDYSDPIISQVVNNLSPIADKVKEIDDQIDESVQKAKLEAQKAKELEEKERDRIEKDWRLHHPIQATLRDWRKGLSDGLDSMTNWMKDDPNWKWLKGFGDAAFGAVGDAVFGVAEFGVDLLQYSTEGVILGYNSLTGNETPQWMKDDLQGGIETFGDVFLNTLGNVFGLVTMIPEVNNLINDLDDSTRDGSIMGAILHDVRHAKDLKQQPIRDKINLVGKFSGYESGHAAGEIVSEIVSWIGPAKLAKMAGGSKLVSRLAQAPKIQKGISYFRKARTALANSHLGMLARESYGATKNFFTSRLGNLWDDFSRKKFAFAGLDDFHYADDIGKHTARLYQSTSEGAEYQRLRQKLYSEAAEQSGRKISQEFRQEASEQLAKHSDDVARGLEETSKGSKKPDIPEVEPRIGERRVSQDIYDSLRKETPTPEIRRSVNEDVSFPIDDPAIPGKIVADSFEADHIVSMDRISKMEGFDKLTREQQLELLNYRDNFEGLSKSANTSKGSKTYEEWTMYKKEGIPIAPDFRARMIAKEQKLSRTLQGLIDFYVNQKGG
jgi:hypothetical protein